MNNWSNHGFSQFGCATSTQQETAASAVQAKMIQESNSASGYGNNDFIPNGFDYFTYTSNGREYSLESHNLWKYDQGFSIDLIISEIDAGRPVMLGYGLDPGTPYYNHMTVCTGYKRVGEDVYVYVSDAHESTYQMWLFNGNTYNNFLSTVDVRVN